MPMDIKNDLFNLDPIKLALFSPYCDENGSPIYTDDQLKNIAKVIVNKFGKEFLDDK